MENNELLKRREYEARIDAENGEKRGMRSISDLMPKPAVKKRKGGVNSEFNNAVSHVVELMKADGKTFGYWCGRLRGFSSQGIFELISKAKQGNRPRALFEHLLKEQRKKDKELSTPILDSTKPKGV